MEEYRNDNDSLRDELLCPVCNEYSFTFFTDICPICGWEHDFVQSYNYEETDYANHLSVLQSRLWFSLKRELDQNYIWKDNSLKDGNPTLEDLKLLIKKVELKRQK